MSTTEYPIDTIQIVPIGDIIVDSNVRKNVTMSRAFVASVKQHGILDPVEASYDPETGKWMLGDGQLRYLASVDTGKTTMRVRVVAAETSEAARLIRQMNLNELRTDLIDADRASTYQTLFDLGVSAAQIAKKLHTPKARVDAGLRITASPAAAAAILEHQLTLDDAALLADVDDNPEDVEVLTRVAGTPQFVHEAARIRSRRDEDNAREQARQQIIDAGITLIDRFDSYNGHEGTKARLDYLYLDKPFGKRITPENHKDCPGHAAFPGVDYNWNAGTRTCEPHIYYACTDWKANGHHSSLSSAGSSSGNGPLDDAEKARRRLARENTKLWVPATDVRRAYITELLQRKELPTGWIDLVARYIAHQNLGDYRGRNMTGTFLGITDSTTLTEWLRDNPTRSANLALAAALADVEAIYEYGKKGWQQPASVAHLQQLSKWGYPLSDIEERVVNGTAEVAK